MIFCVVKIYKLKLTISRKETTRDGWERILRRHFQLGIRRLLHGKEKRYSERYVTVSTIDKGEMWFHS